MDSVANMDCFKPALCLFPNIKDYIAPTRGSLFAAGIDIRFNDNYIICPGRFREITFNLKLNTPRLQQICNEQKTAFYFQIACRSRSHDLILLKGGVIDIDYRGPIKATLLNCGPRELFCIKGESLLQLIPLVLMSPVLESVDPWNNIIGKHDVDALSNRKCKSCAEPGVNSVTITSSFCD
jgi:dUTPase